MAEVTGVDSRLLPKPRNMDPSPDITWWPIHWRKDFGGTMIPDTWEAAYRGGFLVRHVGREGSESMVFVS